MGKVKDETGNRYGKLVVIGRVGIDKRGRVTWLCHCDCGNTTIVRGDTLRDDGAKSCGCVTRLKDETGKRHGRLVVIERAPSESKRAAWLCRCDCGNTAVVLGERLRNGNTRSCGCLAVENHYRLPVGEAAFNRTFSNMKRAAKKRGRVWALTKEQVRELTRQPCYYCGAEPAQVCLPPECNGPYVYNGLDRVDNDLGYEIDNVVACCGTCNKAKLSMSVGEFKGWLTRAYHYFCVQADFEGMG